MLLRFFNALQIVSGWPFLIQWFFTNEYVALGILASVIYAIGFICVVFVTF